MRNLFLVVFFLFFFNCAFCQDTSWREVRIDSFLTVSLPGAITTSDTTLYRNNIAFETKTFNAGTEFVKLGVTIIQTNLNINPYEIESGKNKESYEGVKEGFRTSAEDKGFSLDMKDTIINAVTGFKTNVFRDDRKQMLNRTCYYFCVNSLAYLIIAVPVENKVDECADKIKQIVKSIRFNKKEILAHASNNVTSDSSYDLGVKMGELLFPVLLIGGIVVFFVYKSRKKTTKPYRQNEKL